MADHLVGRFMAFKGEDEYVPQQEVLIEVTEVEGDHVEISLDAPIPGKPRVYIAFSLADLIRHAMKDAKA